MQSLAAQGAHSFYWMPDTNSAKGELDFVLQAKSAEVIPIEVKSGRNVAAKSLKRFIDEARCSRVYRVSERAFGVTSMDGTPCELRSVPLYAAFCLGEL